MPVRNYGVWKGYPITYNFEYQTSSPHLYLYFVDDEAEVGRQKREYPLPPKGGPNPGQREGEKPELNEAAINIMSATSNPLLAFWVNEDFRHPITERLDGLGPGFKSLERPNGQGHDDRALDYLREDLFEPNSGRLVPHNKSGPHNDIIDEIHIPIRTAIENNATIYLFGSKYTDGDPGIHNIHMNQGNARRPQRYFRENGIYQDGALIIRYPDDDRWVAIFLAFAVQATHTDEDGAPVGHETWNHLPKLGSSDATASSLSKCTTM
ncbi:hypothetical protein BBP40_009074 [Aspergillus hancockii]|nr:hypothetical protein BBP40_009074 [Aspergillus hancockii]